ncbi:hypothetical protein [Phreatobacter sp.]|uniref:hypothetical protein n=1 Tax=Phreatobacter sp. TaxID=1966341 RepID=UPI003F72D80C
MSIPVARRLTFLLTGYEPLGPEAHYRRFAREIGRFRATWQVEAKVGELVQPEGRPLASWTVEASGPDWRTVSEIRLLRWDDIVAEDMTSPVWRRLIGYLGAAADMAVTGTFIRYWLAYWRYALFAAYPAVLLLVAAGLAFAGARMWAAFGIPGGTAGAVVAGLALFAGLILFAGKRMHLDYMLSDWIFARDMIRRRRPSIEARAAAFAGEIAGALRAGEADEVVVIGHSLGAAWMVEALGRALADHPDLATRGPPLGLCGLGSSTLKIALHPAAGWLRESVRRIANTPAITWAEYDSHVDFICFYKNNTVTALRIEAASQPVRRAIRLSRMLSTDTWHRFRGNLLRIHRQYVMGNERRYAYDFHMIACGPFRFADIVTHGDDLPEALGPDGSLGRAARRLGAPAEETAPR